MIFVFRKMHLLENPSKHTYTRVPISSIFCSTLLANHHVDGLSAHGGAKVSVSWEYQ